MMNELKKKIVEKINSINPLPVDEINNMSNISEKNIKNNKYAIISTLDEKKYLVDKKILKCSKLLIDLFDDDDTNISTVPINIHSRIVPHLICYMDHHHNKIKNEIEKPIVDNFMNVASISNWDKQFVCTIIDENEKINDLFIECLNASNFLSMSTLCDLLCARFACSIGLSDMTTEMLRTIFNETNDFTPDEEQKIIDELNFIENSYSDNMNKNFFNYDNEKINTNGDIDTDSTVTSYDDELTDDDTIDDDTIDSTDDDLTNNELITRESIEESTDESSDDNK